MLQVSKEFSIVPFLINRCHHFLYPLLAPSAQYIPQTSSSSIQFLRLHPRSSLVEAEMGVSLRLTTLTTNSLVQQGQRKQSLWQKMTTKLKNCLAEIFVDRFKAKNSTTFEASGPTHLEPFGLFCLQLQQNFASNIWQNCQWIDPNYINQEKGQVESLFTFYCKDPSLNPAEVYRFFLT